MNKHENTPVHAATDAAAIVRTIRCGTMPERDIRALADGTPGAPAEVSAAARFVAALLDRIKAGAYDDKALITLHANATAESAAHVISAVEQQMYLQFPAAANRQFGTRSAYTTEMLLRALAAIAARVDVSDSKHKAGVKAGGEALSGRKVLNEYISYRSPGGFVVLLSLEQITASSEVIAYVQVRLPRERGLLVDATLHDGRLRRCRRPLHRNAAVRGRARRRAGPGGRHRLARRIFANQPETVRDQAHRQGIRGDCRR